MGFLLLLFTGALGVHSRAYACQAMAGLCYTHSPQLLCKLKINNSKKFLEKYHRFVNSERNEQHQELHYALQLATAFHIHNLI